METKNIQMSLFICNTVVFRGCIRPLAPASAVFYFQNNQNGLNQPKEIKYNLHYNDVRGALRKHAYSNILKISPPKTENFQIKNSDIFIFLLKTYIMSTY